MPRLRRVHLCSALPPFRRHRFVFSGHQWRVPLLSTLRRRQVRDQSVAIMRIVALAALAIAATAALQYTSTRGLPYYYDAIIFILALTGPVMLVDPSSYFRSKRQKRIVKAGSRNHARIL